MRIRRIIAAFLCFVMVFACLSPEAYASALGMLAHNTEQTNQAILSQVEALTGASGEEILGTLQQLGLLDENGELLLDQKVSLNGQDYSLTEIEKMIDSDADLTQIAYVDDVPIALGDLRTMIEIEKELQYIKQTYLTEPEYTDEQCESLNDLMSYLQGNSLSVEASPEVTPIADYNTISSHQYALEGNFLTDASKQAQYQYVNAAYSMNVKKGVKFSFRFRLLNDKAKKKSAGGEAVVLLLKNQSGGKYSIVAQAQGVDGEFSYTPDKTEVLYLAVGTSESINRDDPNDSYLFYDDVYGAVSFYDCKGVVFQNSFSKEKETSFTVLFSQTSYTGYQGFGRMRSITPSTTSVYTDDSLYGTYAVGFRNKVISGSTDDIFDSTTLDQWGQMILYWAKLARQSPKYTYAVNDSPQQFQFSYTFEIDKDFGSTPSLNEKTESWHPNDTFDGRSGTVVQINNYPAYPYVELFFGRTLETPKQTTATTTTKTSVRVVDNIKENIIKLTIPTTKTQFYPGEYVPILMNTNECTNIDSVLININGKNYNMSDLHMQHNGTLFLMWYQVREDDSSNLKVKLYVNSDRTLNGFDNMWGNDSYCDPYRLEKGHQTEWSFTEIKLCTLQPYRAAACDGMEVQGERAEGAAYNIRVKAKIPDQSNWQQVWLQSYDAAACVIDNDTGAEIAEIPLEVVDDEAGGLAAKGTVQVERGAVAKNCTVRLALKQKGETDYYVRYCEEQALQIPAFAFVNGLRIHDAGSVRELSLSDTYRPVLSLSFSGEPTFSTGRWSSSDADIATVEEKDGSYVVVVTGKKLGKVQFTFTADDGGTADPNPDAVKSAQSEVYTVAAGNSPALVIPDHSENVIVTEGESACVLWSSNASFYTTNAFEYTVNLYKGYYTEAELAGKAALYSTNRNANETSVQIPAGKLTDVSVGMEPTYTVRISMPHPNAQNTKIALSAIAYIVVRPKPATVSLSTDADGVYLLDSRGSVTLSWKVDAYSAGNTKGSVVITRVSGDADAEELYRTDAITQSGSYTLKLKEVGEDCIKDTYMVQAQVSNSPDRDGWSTESFPLYVYRDGFLSLVDEKGSDLPDTLTLDNASVVKNYTADHPNNGQSTDEILRLRETLGLYLYAGVNYDSRSWLLKKDAIQWATSDDDKVHVNYAQGGIYDNISRYSYSEYLPSIAMMLSSDTDGTATVTATHANTGEKDSVKLNVRTLKDRFYLFRISPAAETTLTYTDGSGTKKSVRTDTNGVLALYEPKRINSSITLSSAVDGDIYLGTIYQETLETGEGDYAQGALYPLNTITLRPAARVSLKLKKPDAGCYTGKLTLRGGVYKNGGYCQNALLGTSAHALQDGGKGIVFTPDQDGTITVYMDSTQFWSSENGETEKDGLTLSAEDELYYLFELTGFDNDAYYPAFIDASGNLSEDAVIKSAGNIITLEEKTQEEGAFHLVQQIVTYPGTDEEAKDVSHKNGYIGPSASLPEAELTTLYYILDPDAVEGSYRIEMADQNGVVPACQTSEEAVYPFASYVVVRNTLTMTKSTLTDSKWLNKSAGRRYASLSTRIYKNDVLEKQISTGLKVVDMTTVGDATDAKAVSEELARFSDISTFLTGNLRTGVADKTNDNKVVGALIGLLKTDTIAGDMPVKMILYPTESNTRFKAMIVVGKDDLDVKALDFNDTGIGWGYNYLDTKEAQPMTNKAKRQMAMKAATAVASDKSGTTSGKINAAVSSAKLNNSGTNLNLKLEGFYEAEITYDFVEEKWKIYTVGGGASVGIGIDRTTNINTSQYGIPLTASFSLGGSGQITVSTAVRFNEVSEALKWATGHDNVNDFLVALRLNAYFEAFGGIGYDYSVVAVKVGLFGRISVDAEMDWLLRNYLADPSERKRAGQFLELSGTTGAKFEVDLGLFSFDFILGSGAIKYSWAFEDAQYIQNYWKNTGSRYDDGGGFLLTPTPATLQSRDYLEDYAGSYGTEWRLAYANGDLVTLQDNANPTSEPQTTADGKLIAYVSDCADASIYESRVMAGADLASAVRIDDNLDFEGFGDFSPALSGNKDFAVAAWSRMAASLEGKDSGDAISANERLLLMRSSEIVASVYDGKHWMAQRLTDNRTADLAAASAANQGHAIVAWRSVYTDNAEDMTDFQDDRILCRSYEAGTWGKEQVVYNGTSGTVKSLKLAMLTDGTTLAAYTLQRDDGNTALAYSLLGADGALKSTMFVTDGSGTDENVQLAAVEDGDAEHFFLAWHSTSGDTDTVRFLRVSAEGILSNTFPESADALCSDETVQIPGTFFLAQPGEATDAETILWAQSVDTDGNPIGETGLEADHSVIYGAKLCKVGDGALCLSAPQILAELPARTLLNNLSAYTKADGTICMTMLNTWYDNTRFDYYDAETGLQYEGSGIPDGEGWIIVPKEKCLIQCASGTLSNNIAVDSIEVDYATLALNSLNPIRFHVRNTGLEPISKLCVTLDGSKTEFAPEKSLLPNETTCITAYCTVGDKVTNPDYEIKAAFASEETTVSGTVYLCYPDIGISQMEIRDEHEGKRTVRMTLYNESASTLEAGKHTVKLGLYSNSDYANIESVSCTSSDVKVEANNTLTIAGEAALRQINAGAFTMEVVYDVKAYLERNDLRDIPEDGLYLYADTWIVSDDGVQYEANEENNSECLSIENLLVRSGEALSTALTQDNSGDVTIAAVTIMNNSMRTVQNGALTANLLDENGNLLEQKQVTLEGTMEGESEKTIQLRFTRKGSRISLMSGVIPEDADETEAALTALSFQGWPIDLAGFKKNTTTGIYEATVTVEREKTLVLYQCANNKCQVTIDGIPAQGWTGAAELAGSEESDTHTVAVTNGSRRTEYVLRVKHPCPQDNTCVYAKFTDTGTKAWYHAGVHFCVENGYMQGISATSFAPSAKLSRAMIVTMLWRIEGSPDMEQAASFRDVASGRWFTEPIAWAQSTGIVTGYNSTTFGPNDNVTREQLAAILYRYAKFKGINVGANADLTKFTDSGRISGWAKSGVGWANAVGIINGRTKTTVAPTDSATRAEAASMVQRLCETVLG